MPGQGNGEKDNATKIPVFAVETDVDTPEREKDLVEVLVPEYDKPGTTYDLENERLTLYIAGPMTGFTDFNLGAFNDAQHFLEGRGFKVLNPARRGYGTGDPTTGKINDPEYKGFLRSAVRDISLCDVIVLLEGWENSAGARFELDVAVKLGLSVSYFIDDEEVHLTRFDPNAKPPETVLQEADRLVSIDRQDVYGHPLDDFSKVSGMAYALWGRGPASAEEHALYMILVKLARLSNTPGHHDSIVDIGGYAKTYDLVIEERLRRRGF